MLRQDAQATLCTGRADHLSFAIVQLTLGSHHLDMQCLACRHSLLTLLLCFFVLFYNALDRAFVEEVLLRDMVVLTLKDFAETANSFLQRYILASDAGEDFGYCERLRAVAL